MRVCKMQCDTWRQEGLKRTMMHPLRLSQMVLITLVGKYVWKSVLSPDSRFIEGCSNPSETEGVCRSTILSNVFDPRLLRFIVRHVWFVLMKKWVILLHGEMCVFSWWKICDFCWWKMCDFCWWKICDCRTTKRSGRASTHGRSVSSFDKSRRSVCRTSSTGGRSGSSCDRFD